MTVCLSGGEKQAEELASQLRLAARAAGRELTVDVDCMKRQCDREFTSQLTHDPKDYDAVLSIACGVGVGFMSELFPASRVLPGLNTPSTAPPPPTACGRNTATAAATACSP